MTTLTELHEVNTRAHEFLADVTVAIGVAGDLKGVTLARLDALIAQGNHMAWTKITDRELVTEVRDIMIVLRGERASRTGSAPAIIRPTEGNTMPPHDARNTVPAAPVGKDFPFLKNLLHTNAVTISTDRWAGHHNLQLVYPNGYTASVSTGPRIAGDGVWEIAVMHDGGGIVYDTDIHDHILPRTHNPIEVLNIVSRIWGLPAR